MQHRKLGNGFCGDKSGAVRKKGKGIEVGWRYIMGYRVDLEGKKKDNKKILFF